MFTNTMTKLNQKARQKMLNTGHLHEEKYLCKNFELKEAGGCLLEEGIFSRNLWVYEKTAIN